MLAWLYKSCLNAPQSESILSLVDVQQMMRRLLRKKKEYFQRRNSAAHLLLKKLIPCVLFFLLLRRHTIHPALPSSYFSYITIAKVCISSDIIKPFSGEVDMVVWLKKVWLVVKLQQVNDVVSLLPLYLKGDELALYMEMEEDDQKQIEQIEVQLKEAFTDDAFTAYRKVSMIKWAGECVDVYTNKIRQLVGLAGFKRDVAGEAHETGFHYRAPWHHLNWTSTGAKHRSPDHGGSDIKGESTDNDWGTKPGCRCSRALTP